MKPALVIAAALLIAAIIVASHVRYAYVPTGGVLWRVDRLGYRKPCIARTLTSAVVTQSERPEAEFAKAFACK
jgi:hypothetical protein